jgi:hypothetical protein
VITATQTLDILYNRKVKKTEAKEKRNAETGF